jgi:hypothetical protein
MLAGKRGPDNPDLCFLKTTGGIIVPLRNRSVGIYLLKTDNTAD